MSEKQEKMDKPQKKKVARKQRRLKLYQLYEKHLEEVSYQKGLVLKQGGRVRQIREQAKRCITYEQAYSVCMHMRALYHWNMQANSCAIVHTPDTRQ